MKKKTDGRVREIPTTPLYLIRETEDLERGLDGRLWGEDVAKVICGPVAEEDESVVVSVHDKGTIPLKISEPLDASVGMKNAVGKGKLRAGGKEEILEWNGERSDGSILLEFEGTGGPALLFSADGRLAIVRDIRPNLNRRTSVEPPGDGEGEMTGMKGDVQDRSLAEGWVESEHV
jgi:hypothetical protein